MDIFKNERLQFRLDEQLLRPIGDQFIVKDFSESKFSVSLKNPSDLRHRYTRTGVKRKSESEAPDEDAYGKRMNNENLFLSPQKIPNLLLKNLTGLSKGQFGDYCAKLANAGINRDSAKRSLSLECMALLERTKTRQAIDDRVLQLMYNISKGSVSNYYWEVTLKRFLNTENYARVWCTSWLSNAERDVQYAKIRDSQSLQFRLLLSRFKDPQNRNRRAYGIQLDSCKTLVESR